MNEMQHRLELDGWKTGIRFSACHMLLRHDKCSRLHGHSYSIHFRIFGEMDRNNMVMDFGRIKRVLREYASELDHMVLVPTENRDIKIDRKADQGFVDVDMSGKMYRFPISDVKFIPIPTTTVEEMSSYLLRRLIKELDFPENIMRVELGMDEGVGQGAWASVDVGGSDK